jgi:hypothetical protein
MAGADGNDEDYRDAGKQWRWRYVFVVALVLGFLADAFLASSKPPADADPQPSHYGDQIEAIGEQVAADDRRIEAARRQSIELGRARRIRELEAEISSTQKAIPLEQDSTRRGELLDRLARARRELTTLRAQAAGSAKVVP